MHNLLEKLTKAKNNFKGNKLQDYEVISIIENGAFDMCFKVQDKSTKLPYIWRGLNYNDAWNEQMEADFMSEMHILRQLENSHILQHYDCLLNYESKCIFIVMEYMENDNLEQLIERAKIENKRISENFIWRVFQQICQALQIYENKIKNNKSKLRINLSTKSILLDVEQNNIKLTDFGLKTLVERQQAYLNEDVTINSIGCLIYELCTLRSCQHQFKDLTQELFLNNNNTLWHMYSKDLKELVVFFLTRPENKHNNNNNNNNIENILKHPLAAQHLSKSFDGNQCLLVSLHETKPEECTLMEQNDSIVFSEHNSLLVEYDGGKGLSLDNVFTPDLRAELFYSARRKVFSQSNSDGQLYESICHEEKSHEQIITPFRVKSPSKLTQNVFGKVLLERLHAIRAQERLLQQQQQNFITKERELLEKERRLYNLQTELELRKIQLNMREEELVKAEKKILAPLPPPIPPRKPTNKHDDTYCSIDQDSPTQQPRTIAKLNLAALVAPKSFPTLRKVTFQSPKKFITYNIDTIKAIPANSARSQQMTNNDDLGQSSDNSTTTHKRKSILSIFGLSRSHKDVSSTASTSRNLPFMEQKQRQSAAMETKVLAKCETSVLNNMWTKEHKRAAFDMLAAMNSAGTAETTTTTITAAVHNKTRQSIREKSNSLQRHRLQRRSMITAKTTTATTTIINSKKRENLLI